MQSLTSQKQSSEQTFNIDELIKDIDDQRKQIETIINENNMRVGNVKTVLEYYRWMEENNKEFIMTSLRKVLTRESLQ